MAKKKIKDLTIGQYVKICLKYAGDLHEGCPNCPLFFKRINYCSLWTMDEKVLSREVEVDE